MLAINPSGSADRRTAATAAARSSETTGSSGVTIPATGRTAVRVVDVNSTRYAIARRYMLRVRRDDFDDPDELAALADAANLSVDAFRAMFEPVVAKEPPALDLHVAHAAAPE